MAWFCLRIWLRQKQEHWRPESCLKVNRPCCSEMLHEPRMQAIVLNCFLQNEHEGTLSTSQNFRLLEDGRTLHVDEMQKDNKFRGITKIYFYERLCLIYFSQDIQWHSNLSCSALWICCSSWILMEVDNICFQQA